MIEVIPAIIAKNFSELQEKIRKVEPHTQWVQFDIMDGNFVPNQTWNNPEDLKTEDFSVFFETHLMISQPEKYIDKWVNAGMKRIIVHIEAIGEESSHTKKDPAYHLIKDMAQKCHNANIEFGLAVSPETPVELIYDFIPDLDLVLFLTVSPGFGGQKFRGEVLPKIATLRKKYPNIKIEVDGGINPKTGKRAMRAGANILVAGSYIINSRNPQKAIEGLSKI